MPRANIGGATINYEVLGTSGPWVSLSPGGRRDLNSQRSVAEKVAALGYRVLVHDRRNCGASDLVVSGDKPEYEIWADDLAALLEQLGGTPAWIGGSSSGARLAITMALRYPQRMKGVLLYRTTGGEYSCKRLAEQYYGQFVKMARAGGMQKVAESEHFREVISRNPAARDQLLGTPVERFCQAFEHWSAFFLKSATDPVIGASEADLRSIRLPVVCIPGNDVVHPRKASYEMAKFVPGIELHEVMPPGDDLTEIPFEEWDRKDSEIARIFVDFMRKHGS